VKALELVLTRLERIRISSHNVQPFFQALYRYGGFLVFTPIAAIVCAALAVLGAAAALVLFRDVHDMLEGFGGHALRGILAVKLLFFASVALPPVRCTGWPASIIGVACASSASPSCTASCRPSTSTSPTSSWRAAAPASSPRSRARSCIWSSAPSPSSSPSSRRRAASRQAFAAASGIIQWQALLVALYPFCFIEMDGYHIFVDVLGVPTLKNDAIAYAKGLLTGGGAGGARS